MSQGQLFIVATPIGHLNDITLRAIEVLKSVDTILCEDTRHSRTLLSHYGIKTPLSAFHQHNERHKTAYWTDQLAAGKSVALISDAGTPLVSDPGYYLVMQAHVQGIKVVPIPGASALVAALSVSGLATDAFKFVGFLSSKPSKRQQQIAALKHETATLVLYEAPHRLMEALEAMIQGWGNRKVSVQKELTKHFEANYVGSISDVIAQLKDNPDVLKGEFVVVVAGAERSEDDGNEQLADALLKALNPHLPAKLCAQIVSKSLGLSKNELYQKLLDLKDES